MKKLLLLAAVLTAFASCKKDKTIVSPGLYGTWELRTIMGGWGTNQTIAPGKGERYQFNTSDTYTKTKDDKIQGNGSFVIKYDNYEHNGYKFGSITFTNPDYSDAFAIKKDTINIGTSIADGPTYQYIKIK